MPVVLENVKHVYMPGTPFEITALDDVSLTINDGELVGLAGHTGSGKSTLIQHINGLLKPTSGRVTVNDIDASDKSSHKELRRTVGLVFQYPEYQLFDETVEKDIAFGPLNLGCDREEAYQRAGLAMELVGLEASARQKSPFELSGGQRRKAAIAGVLAMQPKILMLDEPIAGLDPAGRKGILDIVTRLHQSGVTIIMVSHNMDDLAKIAGRIIIMKQAGIHLDGSPREVFSQVDEVLAAGLEVPYAAKVAHEIRLRGKAFPSGIITIKELEQAIAERIKA